ncbi:hypothetical protein BGZ60DRAFT_537282 [Tricladium varicosporioides]|nr:hypothetical protein BGZ60DRAFT_537282 [Hymenoscyphus varicosporioides]
MAQPHGPRIPGGYLYPQTKMDTPLSRTPNILNLLSDELLLQIIEYVGCSTEFSEYGGIAQHGPKQLRRLASCSRRLHKITLPVLYSHYREHQEYTDTATKENCLQLFLCQILERPELAKYVQVWHGLARDNQNLEDNINEDYWYDDNPLDMSRLEQKHWDAIHDLLTLVTNHNNDESKKWASAIKHGSWDAVTALLLSVLPNLEELEFEGYSYTDTVYPYLTRVLSRAKTDQDLGNTGPGSLHRLRRVALEYWDTESGLFLDPLIPYLTLPSVKSFYGRMLNQSTYDDDNDRLAPLRAGLKLHTKTLYLVHSSISQSIFEVFFSAFDRLERVIYDHHTVGNPKFEPPRIMAALAHLAPTLKELTLLNLEGVGASSYENYPVGCLRKYEKLKKLDMNAGMLIGFRRSEWELNAEESWESKQNLVDSLPPNLEYLRLRDPRPTDVPFIISFISSKLSTCPNFQTLELDWERIQYPNSPPSLEPFIHPGFTKEEAIELWELCKKMGVEIPMRIEPPRWKNVSWRDKGLRDGLISTVHTRGFEWPYEGYKDLCIEMGCEIETGRREGEMY